MPTTAYSELKILHHTKVVDNLIRGGKERTAPIYIRIKPTNICNQRCYYCVYADDIVFDSRKVNHRESIPWEKMQEILSDIKDMGVKALTFSGGGEPLCYHSIIPALKMVYDIGIDYSMITNAQELQGEKSELLENAKWIRVSMDATNSESYKKIRNVSTYERVIGNIENFAKKKKEYCTLGINFVVTNDSYKDIYEFCEKMKEIGVNNIKFSPLLIKGDVVGYHDKIRGSVEEQLERAKINLQEESFQIVDKYTGDMMIEKDFKKSYKRCYMKEVFTVIAADQRVYFCHQKAYRQDGLIGDISNRSFKELWYSDEVSELFKKHDASRECCFRCAFEERNILLNDLVNLDKNHINFV